MKTFFVLPLLTCIVSCSSIPVSDAPVVTYPVTYPADDRGNYRGKFINQSEADEIVRVVKAVPNIDHRVRLISVKSVTDVEVHTGPSFRSGAGATLHMRKAEGRWVVVEKFKESGFR